MWDARLLAQIGPFSTIEANNTQHIATHRNMVAKRTQHLAFNNVAICYVGMLRLFGRGMLSIARMLSIAWTHMSCGT